MKRAAGVLRSLVVADVGLEGAFLVIGTVCLAVFADHYIVDGAWAVVGAVAFVIGLLLSAPRKAA